jgi:GAF domain-containing protein
MSRDYREVAGRIRAVCEGEDDAVALMATVACELFHGCEGFDWVGFYRVVAPGLLKIGPYQGGHGCLSISFERGVCGAAARERRTQVVDDVDAFPGHIACSSSTRSEIVVPVLDADGELLAVLDVDSDRPGAFDAGDAAALEALVTDVFAPRRTASPARASGPPTAGR